MDKGRRGINVKSAFGRGIMKALLVHPQFSPSFWSFERILRVAGRKGLFPPLGLMTVAALLPREWELRLVDCNVRPLRDDDWAWADVVLMSGMTPQKREMLDLVRESRARGKRLVAGGPCVSSMPGEFRRAGCPFVVVGEAEGVVAELVAALERGDEGGFFECSEKPDLARTPFPRYDLIRMADYVSLALQTSRGCPYQCDFCDVIRLLGRVPRYKRPEQVVAELEGLYRLGYRGSIFISDDNLIGSRRHAQDILRAIMDWNLPRGEPFGFVTQASMDLGTDPEMIDLMTAANVGTVFIGIETPDEAALKRSGKMQNVRASMVEAVNNIKRNGLTVLGSFIVGFDHEAPGVSERIVRFIEGTDMPIAMVNLLQAPPNTPLWNRLASEGRLDPATASDISADDRLNFTPTRPESEILAEFADIWDRVYDPVRFYPRVARYYIAMRPTRSAQARARGERLPDEHLRASGSDSGIGGFRILLHLLFAEGVLAPTRRSFWKSLAAVRRSNPSRLRAFILRCAEGLSMQDMRAQVLRRSTAPGPRAP